MSVLKDIFDEATDLNISLTSTDDGVKVDVNVKISGTQFRFGCCCGSYELDRVMATIEFELKRLSAKLQPGMFPRPDKSGVCRNYKYFEQSPYVTLGREVAEQEAAK